MKRYNTISQRFQMRFHGQTRGIRPPRSNGIEECIVLIRRFPKIGDVPMRQKPKA